MIARFSMRPRLFSLQKTITCTLFIFILLFSFLPFPGKAAESTVASVDINSALDDPGFFPIGVWLQAPKNAARFKETGINLYVGLWQGPTAMQLEELVDAGMPVICHQNEIALNNPNNDNILAWLQQDEPDNSQKRKMGFIYNPPITPQALKDNYIDLKRNDSTRPVFLNLGQGVAWDNWKGRGTRTNHPEDYIEYVKAADIVSFDIYPVTHRSSEVRGRLEYVAKGVERLKSWTTASQKVWNIIGVSRIDDADIKPTPFQIRSQVWMSIVHGSRGIIYFVHQFKPRFIEAAIFGDPEMVGELTQLNCLLKRLAKVLNSPDTQDINRLTSDPDSPIAAITKRYESFLYIFSVGMGNKETIASFELSNIIPDQKIELLGENRSVEISGAKFKDHFAPYEPHIYKIAL